LWCFFLKEAVEGTTSGFVEVPLAAQHTKMSETHTRHHAAAAAASHPFFSVLSKFNLAQKVKGNICKSMDLRRRG
jgi:hypothetical protein